MSKRIKLIELCDNTDSNTDNNTNNNTDNNATENTFRKKIDTHGRLVFAFHTKDLKENQVSRAIFHQYKTAIDSTDITFFIPTVTLIGAFVLENDTIVPSGEVRLFHSNTFGQQLIFSGIMEKNDFIRGTLFAENGTKTFQGTFTNNLFHDGITYHCNGSVKWKGSFKNGNPHGPGDFYTYCNRYIKGIMNNGILVEGTMYKDSFVEYEGQFKGSDFHGRGIYYPNGRSEVPFERYIGEFSNGSPLFCLWESVSITNQVPLNAQVDHKLIYKYAGGFIRYKNKDSKIVFHGMGALFFRLPDSHGITKLIKWVGRFHYGKRVGIFRIFIATEADPLLSVSSWTTGQWSSIPEDFKFVDLENGILLGTTSFVDGLQMGSIEKFKLGKLLYEGSGHVSLTEIVDDMFIEDGQGTKYNINTGYPLWKAWYSNGKLKIIGTLYDDNGHKLFQVDDDYCFTIMADDIYDDLDIYFMDAPLETEGRWPLLNGPGNVYDTDGSTIMYHTNMNNGVLEETPDVPVQDYPVNENKLTDYISFDTLRRGYYAIAFNGGEEFQQFVGMNTFSKLITDVPLKDPLKGSYPGYRFKKFKLI